MQQPSNGIQHLHMGGYNSSGYECASPWRDLERCFLEGKFELSKVHLLVNQVLSETQGHMYPAPVKR